MAERYTPEEIQDIFDRYNDAIRLGIPITEALAKEMADATKGVKNYTNQLNYSFKQLGSTVKDLGSNLAKGGNGASVFNSSIEAGADVVSKFASKMGVLGTVIGGVIKAGGMYVSAVNKQSDALYKSFQDISKAGTLGAGGMAEVFNSMQKFGYAVDELGQMQSLLAENSQALAAFGGTAFRGARQFANVAEVLQRGELGEKFRNMGQSVDDINKNAAGYIKTQIMLGQSRANMERNLTGETEKYIQQIVAVQKLTGQTREQLEAKQEEALQEEAFAATQNELRQRMLAGDEQARKEFIRNQALSQILEGKARQQFIAGVGGDVAAMGDLLRTAPETVEKILNGGDLASVMDSLAREGKQAVDSLGPLAKFHGFNNFLLPYNELQKLVSQYGTESFNELIKAAEKNSITVDDATRDQTKMLMAQMNTRQAFESLINNGIDPVTKAMRVLAEIIDGIVGMLPNFGQRGYGRSGTGTLGGSLAATGAGAATGAAIGSVVPGVGTAIGAAVGGIGGYLGFEGFGGRGGGTGATGGLTGRDVLDFAGASGSESNFNQLEREVQGRVIAAGEQYLKVTGRKLIINSAMRSRAEQERLYNETVSAGRPGVGPTGMPVARPGTSSHESGLAIDIQQGKGDREAINALNQQGLYQTVPSDPVHFSLKNVSGAFGWQGRISGPMSGYRPNILMHGEEDLEIKPARASGGFESQSLSNEMASKLIERVDDLIYISRNQLGVNEKMLRYQA
jgi:hypothetical protein